MQIPQTFRIHRKWWALGAAAVAVVALVLVLIGGGREDPGPTTTLATGLESSTSTSQTIPGASSTSMPSDGPVEPVDRNPLTGAPLEDPSELQVIAVKVGNSPGERPQMGLAEAGLVFETVLEGGLTRFLALYFEGEPDTVGPVRSIRPVDAAVLAPFQPFFVFSGGQDFVYRLVTAAGINLTDEAAGEAVYRGSGAAPYNLVVDFASARSLAIGRPPAAPVYQFAEGFSGDSASELDLTMGGARVQYRFEDGTGYVRMQDAAPFNVLSPSNDSEPFVRDTVIVQFVAQRSAGYADVKGAEVPDFDVIGFGEALIFHGGQVVPAEWRRASQASGTLFFGQAGEPLPLPIGSIIVELVPTGSEFSYR
jgi:hypothetical protein